MAIIKFFSLALMLFILVVSPSATFAQQCDKKDSQGKCLDTCNTSRYCDEKAGKWMDKKCERSVDYRSSESMGELNSATDKVCVCTYTVSRQSCIAGGAPQTGSDVDGVFGRVEAPAGLPAGSGAEGISNFIQRVIQLLYMIAGVGFVIFFLWNALQLIISGGDKDKVAGARKHITWSIIGITLMALAFPLLRVLETIIGIKFFF